jgi:coproporphyrinogen III oxidase
MPKPQDELLKAIINALPGESPSPISVEVKKALANAVREHYRKHPEALGMQASGNTTPSTVENHK